MRKVFQSRRFLAGGIVLFLGAAVALGMYLVGMCTSDGFDFSVQIKEKLFYLPALTYLVAVVVGLVCLVGVFAGAKRRGTTSLLSAIFGLAAIGALAGLLIMFGNTAKVTGFYFAKTIQGMDLKTYIDTYVNLKVALPSFLCIIALVTALGGAVLGIVALITGFCRVKVLPRILGIIALIALVAAFAAYTFGTLIEIDAAKSAETGKVYYKFTSMFEIKNLTGLIHFQDLGIALAMCGGVLLFSPIVFNKGDKKAEKVEEAAAPAQEEAVAEETVAEPVEIK